MNDDLAEQYDQIEVLPGEYINSQITVTKNAADLGGIETAYDALLSTLAIEGATPNPALGAPCTPEQQFFIAAATVWRGEMRDEALLTRIRSGVHAPPAVRATQPLRNMDEFHEAFGIRESDPMYLAPEEHVRIW